MELSLFYFHNFMQPIYINVGYQAKEWRMEWLKRRRERLAVKLQETQREIELMKTN